MVYDERVADDLADAFNDGYERGYADGVCAIKTDYEEIIERDKPKKPARTRLLRRIAGICTSCGTTALRGYECFCPICGQRLDWSE